MDLTSFEQLQRYLEEDNSDVTNQIETEIANKNPKTVEEEVIFYCIGLVKATTQQQQIRCLEKLGLCQCEDFKNSEFSKQAQTQLSILRKDNQTIDLGTFTVSEGDDWADIFSSGRVGTSCQRIDGDPRLNQGLLGYLLNGQTRMISVKDPEGKIVARSLLRFYLDQAGQPVLFLSRCYSNISDPRMELAIEYVAKMKAKEMGLVLTSTKGTDLYGQSLTSLGGVAPEYFDEAEGIRAHGNATVWNVKIVP